MNARENLIAKRVRAIKRLKGKIVKAGWFESNLYPNGYSVARNAAFQNSGGIIEANGKQIVIPARPFMDLAAQNFKKQIKQDLPLLTKKIMADELKPQQALGQIGLRMEGEIKKAILEGHWTPNAPATLKRKGKNLPLIDTTIMIQTIISKIEG